MAWDTSVVAFALVCAALTVVAGQSIDVSDDVGQWLGPLEFGIGASAGYLLASRQDVLGKASRAVGGSAASAVGALATHTGEHFAQAGVSATGAVVGAVTGAVGAVTGAVEEVVVKTPARAVGAAGRAVTDSASNAVRAVLGLPSQVSAALGAWAMAALQLLVATVQSTAAGAADAVVGRPVRAAVRTVSEAPQKAVEGLASIPLEAGRLVRQKVTDTKDSVVRTVNSGTLARAVFGGSASMTPESQQQAAKPAAAQATADPKPEGQVQAQTAAPAPAVPAGFTAEELAAEREALELERKLASLQEVYAQFEEVRGRLQQFTTAKDLRDSFALNAGRVRVAEEPNAVADAVAQASTPQPTAPPRASEGSGAGAGSARVKTPSNAKPPAGKAPKGKQQAAVASWTEEQRRAIAQDLLSNVKHKAAGQEPKRSKVSSSAPMASSWDGLAPAEDRNAARRALALQLLEEANARVAKQQAATTR